MLRRTDQEPIYVCPDCYVVLDLDEDHPDRAIYVCERCGEIYTPARLRQIEAEQRERITPPCWFTFFGECFRWFFLIIFAFFIFTLIYWILR